MKRSFLAVTAAASVLAFTACGGPDTDADIEPVEDVQPAPAPAPMPEPLPADTMMQDTMVMDTTPPTE
ncbi:MAG TPA: hypothetical protein VK929_07340 [Longimicrobiales bacterium]|nr:hypothetical protein [Longimicrobiales bacterium]